MDSTFLMQLLSLLIALNTAGSPAARELQPLFSNNTGFSAESSPSSRAGDLQSFVQFAAPAAFCQETQGWVQSQINNNAAPGPAPTNNNEVPAALLVCVHASPPGLAPSVPPPLPAPHLHTCPSFVPTIHHPTNCNDFILFRIIPLHNFHPSAPALPADAHPALHCLFRSPHRCPSHAAQHIYCCSAGCCLSYNATILRSPPLLLPQPSILP